MSPSLRLTLWLGVCLLFFSPNTKLHSQPLPQHFSHPPLPTKKNLTKKPLPASFLLQKLRYARAQKKRRALIAAYQLLRQKKADTQQKKRQHLEMMRSFSYASHNMPHLIWQKWQKIKTSLKAPHQKKLFKAYFNDLFDQSPRHTFTVCKNLLKCSWPLFKKINLLQQWDHNLKEETKYFDIAGYQLLQLCQKSAPHFAKKFKQFETCYRKNLIKKQIIVKKILKNVLKEQSIEEKKRVLIIKNDFYKK